VHNKPIRDILTAAYDENPLYRLYPEKRAMAWALAEQQFDLEQNDIEWLTEFIRDTCVEFPSTPEIFQIYRSKLPARDAERYNEILMAREEVV
jgi:hypothetical protein